MTTNAKLGDLLREITAHVISLKRQVADAEHLQRTAERVHGYVEQKWPAHVVDVLGAEGALLERLLAEQHPAAQLLRQALDSCRELARSNQLQFPKLFEEACATRIVLDRDSRHPKYSLEGGYLHAEIDDGRQVARVADLETELAKLPSDADAVVTVLVREWNRLFGRPFDGAAVLGRVRRHYLAIVAKRKVTDGDSVPIRALTRRMHENEAARVDEVLVDLGRLVDRGPHEIDGRRLDLQQTKNTTQGALLPGFTGRGYIGFICFKPS